MGGAKSRIDSRVLLLKFKLLSLNCNWKNSQGIYDLMTGSDVGGYAGIHKVAEMEIDLWRKVEEGSWVTSSSWRSRSGKIRVVSMFDVRSIL